MRLKKSPEEIKDMIRLAIQKGYKQIKVSDVNPNEILLRVPKTYNIMSFEFISPNELKFFCMEGHSFKCIYKTNSEDIRKFLEEIYAKAEVLRGSIKEIKEVPKAVVA
ncbi:hypothetical protein ACO3VM_02830 [Methanocaldococcus sp. 10A]